jgi:hypothetical protein
MNLTNHSTRIMPIQKQKRNKSNCCSKLVLQNSLKDWTMVIVNSRICSQNIYTRELFAIFCSKGFLKVWTITRQKAVKPGEVFKIKPATKLRTIQISQNSLKGGTVSEIWLKTNSQSSNFWSYNVLVLPI